MYKSRLKPQTVIYDYFHFEQIDNDLLEKIYSEFKDEISDEKYTILKRRIRPDSTDRCYAVIDNESRIYGYYSVSLGDNYEPTMDIIISANPEELYMFDDFTFTKRRGKKAHHYSILKRQQIGYEMGYRFSTSIIISGNIPSQRAYCSAGYYRIKKIDYYNFMHYKKAEIKEL